MRRIHIITLTACVLAIGLILQAAEPPSAEFKKAMQDIGACVQALSKPGATEDMDLAKNSAVKMKDAFTLVERYWHGRDTDAAKLANTAIKAAADIQVSTQFNSVEGVTAGMKDLTATCATCHTAHREKTADGFVIK
jgi:hypothetical protein